GHVAPEPAERQARHRGRVDEDRAGVKLVQALARFEGRIEVDVGHRGAARIASARGDRARPALTPAKSRNHLNLPTLGTPTPMGGPASEAKMPKIDQRRDAVSGPGTSGVAPARILVVEDNSLNRLLVHDILELRGHEVVEAANVDEALGQLERE